MRYAGRFAVKNSTCVSQILTDQQFIIKVLNLLQNNEMHCHTFDKFQIRRLKHTRYIGQMI
jgi:hypothetical protein